MALTLGRLGVVSLLVLAGCGGDGGPPPQGDGSSGIDPTKADDDGEADGTDSASASASGEAGDSSGSDGDGDGDGDAADNTVWDVGNWDEVEGCGPEGGDGGTEGQFSIIWIANSPEGTVSKIDTETATELARYATGPDAPDPSRTAVNLRGDVAVSNRRGTITKIAAQLEDCVDQNGNGEIETSQASDDVLPWGEDECVLWHHESTFPDGYGSTGGPRGTAWTAGEFDEEVCEMVGANLWVGWRNQPGNSVTIRLIDGDTGDTIQDTIVDDWAMNWGHGMYGAAADADGNLWGLGTRGSIVRVDADDFSVERWDNPASHTMYGIALDAEGTPWVAGWSGNIWKFDTTADEWVDMGDSDGGPARLRGLAIDTDGYAWVAGNNPCGLVQYDTQGETLVQSNVALPDCSGPVGVSIDAAGKVWVVDRDADRAYRVDPSDYSVVTVEGLVGPYTYSDMTGAGLNLVVNPPG